VILEIVLGFWHKIATRTRHDVDFTFPLCPLYFSLFGWSCFRAMTGFLSLVITTLHIGNIFILFGNVLLAGLAAYWLKDSSFTTSQRGVGNAALYTVHVICMHDLWCSEAVIAFIVM
jgi:hypothetical protein